MPLFRTLPPADAAEIAWLAYHTYNYSGEPLAARLAPHGWSLPQPSELGMSGDRFNDSGYYAKDDAEAFVAVRGDTLALMFRGSENIEDLVSVALAQDRYYDNLDPLIDATFAFAAAQPAIQTLFIGGQSLGGAMVARTAASLPDSARALTLRLATFGSPGTDVDDDGEASRAIVNVHHSGDPVPGAPLLDHLDEPGSDVEIDLPNVAGAKTLARLGAQKVTDQNVTEHDALRYFLSVEAIAGSPLYGDAAPERVPVVLDTAEGDARDDFYRVKQKNAFVLGLGGDDTLNGGGRADLLDGGLGNDRIVAKKGDDVIAGGAGDDVLDGGRDVDLVVVPGLFGSDFVLQPNADGTVAVVPVTADAQALGGRDLALGVEHFRFADGHVETLEGAPAASVEALLA